MTYATKASLLSAAALATAVGVGYGVHEASMASAPQADYVASSETAAPGDHLLQFTVRASSADLARYGLRGAPDSGQGYRYVTLRVCAPAGSHPGDLDYAQGQEQDLGNCAVGAPKVQIWEDTAQNSAAAFGCACGRGCVHNGKTGVGGVTFQPGTWAASDAGVCIPTPCTVLAGSSAGTSELSGLDPACD